jgi:hypothetical protein
MKLAIWGTSTLGKDAVVSHNNGPIAFRDPEAAKRFKVLSAGDKCPSAVLSHRPGETVSGDDQISALVHL